MPKMKVKNLLKIVSNTEIQITVKGDPTTPCKFKTYYINYLSRTRGISYNGDTHMECDSIVFLPDHVLESKVTYVSAFEGRFDISCYGN